MVAFSPIHALADVPTFYRPRCGLFAVAADWNPPFHSFLPFGEVAADWNLPLLKKSWGNICKCEVQMLNFAPGNLIFLLLMKKIICGAMAAVLLSSCGGSEKAADNQSIDTLLSERLENSKNWEDSVISVEGTFLGGYYNYNLHNNPQVNQETLNMKEIERGIRQVMATDTAEMSYVLGIQIGLQILETYRMTSADMPLDKGKFMESVMGALRLDSVGEEQIKQIYSRFEETNTEVQRRKQQEIEKEIFNSPEAEQNRIMAQSISSKFQSNPDFKQIGNTGIYCCIDQEGEGELLAPNDRVKVTFTVLHLSGEPVENAVEKAMFPARGYNPMLTEVLKYMRHGEKAKFFIPYEYAYGVEGNSNFGVGPCESLYMDVEVL